MINAIIAGFFNALGTVFLRNSSQSIFFIFFSIIFYGINFYLFKISLKVLNPATAYSILILITLLFIKSYEIFFLRNSIGLSDFVGIVFFVIGAFYLIN